MNILLLCVAFLASQEGGKTRSSHLQLPMHGTVYKGALHGFFGESGGDFGLDAIPIDRPPKARMKVYDFPRTPTIPPGNNFRHQIQYNGIWVASSHISLCRIDFADLRFYAPKNADLFLKKYPDSSPHEIISASLFDKYERIAQKQLGLGLRNIYPTDILGFGNVAASKASFKSYILPRATKQFEIWDNHFRWDEKANEWKPKPSTRLKKIHQWITDLGSSDFQKRSAASEELEKLGELAEPALKKLLESKPPLEPQRRAQTLLELLASGESKAERLCEDADNYERFPSAFAEDFYFFMRKNDYYFVTESGKVFLAASPTNGKTRTMKSLWEDPKRPIAAIIEDADNDRVWLFAKNKSPDARDDVFFELTQTIRPQEFDRTKLRPVNVEGRARVLLEYLPLIRGEPKK